MKIFVPGQCISVTRHDDNADYCHVAVRESPSRSAGAVILLTSEQAVCLRDELLKLYPQGEE